MEKAKGHNSGCLRFFYELRYGWKLNDLLRMQ